MAKANRCWNMVTHSNVAASGKAIVCVRHGETVWKVEGEHKASWIFR